MKETEWLMQDLDVSNVLDDEYYLTNMVWKWGMKK